MKTFTKTTLAAAVGGFVTTSGATDTAAGATSQGGQLKQYRVGIRAIAVPLPAAVRRFGFRLAGNADVGTPQARGIRPSHVFGRTAVSPRPACAQLRNQLQLSNILVAG